MFIWTSIDQREMKSIIAFVLDIMISENILFASVLWIYGTACRIVL